MYERNWKSLIRPCDLELIPGDNPETEATVIAGPLERGFGLTLGNSLRRVLLSSLRGGAIIGVRVDGILHEFSSVSGVLEDMTDIILNLKGVALKVFSEENKRLKLKVSGPAVVTAGMIECPTGAEVVNPDHYICTVEAGASISMELMAREGKGYVPASSNRDEDQIVGYIAIDATFTPIKKVSMEVTNARIGQVTDYNMLKMNIETNGAITPKDAVALAAGIIRDQLTPFINFVEKISKEENVQEEVQQVGFNKVLFRKVSELPLSVRSHNCLRSENIIFVGDLVNKDENELMKLPNFGRKSLNEIREVLLSIGLELGTRIDGWPPENLTEIEKRLNEVQ
jgi:DNA-directed RNA polymerase subunit alpha